MQMTILFQCLLAASAASIFVPHAVLQPMGEELVLHFSSRGGVLQQFLLHTGGLVMPLSTQLSGWASFLYGPPSSLQLYVVVALWGEG